VLDIVRQHPGRPVLRSGGAPGGPRRSALGD